MSTVPRYESWPPSPGGPAPYVPPQTPAYGYGGPAWQQPYAPVQQPAPVRAERSNVVPVVLAIVCAPIAVLFLVVVVSGLFVLAPLGAVAVPAGAVMLAITRPSRASRNRRQANNVPAPSRTSNRNTKTKPALSKFPNKKG